MNRRFIAVTFLIAIVVALLAPLFGAEPLRYDALRAGVQVSRTVLAWVAGAIMAASFATRVVLLDEGHAAAFGPPEQVFTRPAFQITYQARRRVS